MRIFTDIEKQLLRRINSGNSRGLYSLIDPWINGVSFYINLETNKVTFIFDTSVFPQHSDIIDKLEEIQSILIQAVNLIKLFEDKGYFFTVKISQQFPNPFIWGRAIPTAPSIPYEFPDPRISELITRYSTQEIFVTPELDKFINDKFITREEGRANRQWITTMATLCVAIFALLFNIGIKISDIYSHNSNTNNINNKPIISGIKEKTDTTIISDTTITATTIVTNIKTDTLKK